MSIKSFFLGLREFKSKADIIGYITKSKHFDASKESTDKANALKIFETSNQQTWLVATDERLYCILDDVRKPKPHINWSIPRSQIISGGDVILRITARNSRKHKSIGLVDFGPHHKNWFYSKVLFKKKGVEDTIRHFLLNSWQGIFQKYIDNLGEGEELGEEEE